MNKKIKTVLTARTTKLKVIIRKKMLELTTEAVAKTATISTIISSMTIATVFKQRSTTKTIKTATKTKCIIETALVILTS